MEVFQFKNDKNSTENLPFFALILSNHFYWSNLPVILTRFWPAWCVCRRTAWNKLVSISFGPKLWPSIFNFFFKFEFIQFYNWPREISRDDVTKINLLWIKITFLDYLTPFIPNGLTIPLRPSSALNQEIQSAFGSESACPPNPDSQLYRFFSLMMDYISHAFLYPNFFLWKVVFLSFWISKEKWMSPNNHFWISFFDFYHNEESNHGFTTT